MKSTIAVHPSFDHIWPWAADALHELWAAREEVQLVRVPPGFEDPVHRALENPEKIERLAVFGLDFTEDCLNAMPALRELAAPVDRQSPLAEKLKTRNVRLIWQTSEGFWGQSVAEFALALTLCGLRRIPQTHCGIITDLDLWKYRQPDGIGRPGQRGQQFGDDPRFVHGTLEGKRVRIVGAGNIGSRYASFCHALGAEVAAWDPHAGEPCFHRSGARREHFLERLVGDAEVFAPMLPLLPATRGIIHAGLIDALPRGTLVVTVTRAGICDTEALYRRVLNDELALAADVFAPEPLPIDHPLLGRQNVVHTPHNAGRTREANIAFARALADQFKP